ncbi:MAG: hypothetical protein HY672_00520 [Chloroflexi bacterium]|nr:hypothetical protein [Chloroflexota bacterium]
MIWVRRFFTIPLGLVFIVLFIVTMVVFRLNATVLEPKFYKEELAKAEIYDFALGELPTSAIEELRSKEPDFFSESLEENPLDTLSLTTDDIVSSLRRSLSPSWVQEQVEQVIEQAGGHVTGERDSFEITIEAGERAKATTQEVKGLIRKAHVYDLLFDEIVTPEIDKALEKEGTLPFKVALTGEDLVGAVKRVAPEDWVKDQLDQALDEVTAYMVGDQETFEVNVQLAERADVALEEIKALLKKADFFELLFDEVLGPMVTEKLPSYTDLPFGVSITQEEVSSALKELVPPSWLEEQALSVIDEAGPYLTGKTDTFQVVIPLAERRETALTVIDNLAKSKLDTLLRGLPECRADQFPFQGPVPSLNELPQCLPQGIPVETVMGLLNVNVTDGVRQLIGNQIPDQAVFTQADLRKALEGVGGADTLERLDRVREIIAQGWTYTDVDFRNNLGEDNVEMLDKVRAALSDGWTYTDVDLREDLANAGDGNGEALKNLDTFRAQLSRARGLRFLVYVLGGLLLALIGILGGRHWWSRIAWAAATLGIAATIVFVASGPVYSSVVHGLMDNLRADVLQDMDSPTQLLAAEKGLDVAQMVLDDLVGGIRNSSLALLIVALVVLVAAFAWPRLVARRASPTAGDGQAT